MSSTLQLTGHFHISMVFSKRTNRLASVMSFHESALGQIFYRLKIFCLGVSYTHNHGYQCENSEFGLQNSRREGHIRIFSIGLELA